MIKTLTFTILLAFVCRIGLAQVGGNTQHIDSLKLQLASAQKDTNKIWTLIALSERYTWSFADTAVMYAQQALQLSKELNFRKGEAFGMADWGSALTTLGNYTNALDFIYKSIVLFKELNDSLGLAYAHGALGICYRDQGDYKQAIQNIREDIRIRQLMHFKTDGVEGMMASVYERNNQLDSALFYAEKVYYIDDNWSGILTVLGAIHSKFGNNQLALKFYKKAINIAIGNNAQVDILDAYNGIAQVYLNEGKTDSAIYFAKETLVQKWGKAYPIGMLHASMLLADIYESKNVNDSTLKYLKMTISLKDSLFNQQKIREAQSFAFNEKFYQQELNQKVEQTELIGRNRQNIIILIAGLVLVLIVALGLWRKNIYKKRANAFLQHKNDEIENQKNIAEKTLGELKATQSQLIQSEKMASLGELTAGIAHEIQNPLNFVNNFSEVNSELIAEMKEEIEKGNLEEVKALANDIADNEQKINHHGKRADAIVKGMLQHSRSSSGVKEPTDINKLADEYLRLAYHGLRAKDKSFNATMKTDFDASIGNINIIPQDIGRVILNLITNAFYAVNEKNKSNNEGYEPVVKISTKKLDDKIEIKVSDNGNGIPQKILDKIFQPFFTTKPTGEGTGLGLSMSYDIVKAHDGELKVETKEGVGSEFIIQLYH